MSFFHRIGTLGLRCVAAALCSAAMAACGDASSRIDRPRGDTLRSLELTDAIGRRVRLDAPARSVVSLAPNLTEILFAIGAGPQVVGRTAYCDHPPEAARVAVVSDMSSPDYEQLVRLRPDLVLMTFAGNTSAAYDRLVSLGLRPYSIAAETLDGTLAAIDTIGMLVGRRDSARALVGAIRRQVDSVASLASSRARVSVFVVLDRSPLMTISGGFINEAIERAGGRNIAAGDPAAYPRFSREEVLRRDPDVIIVPSDSAVTPASLVASFPEWSRLRAVREGRVRAIAPDILFRPGPRIGQAVVALHQALELAPQHSRSRFSSACIRSPRASDSSAVSSSVATSR